MESDCFTSYLLLLCEYDALFFIYKIMMKLPLDFSSLWIGLRFHKLSSELFSVCAIHVLFCGSVLSLKLLGLVEPGNKSSRKLCCICLILFLLKLWPEITWAGPTKTIFWYISNKERLCPFVYKQEDPLRCGGIHQSVFSSVCCQFSHICTLLLCYSFFSLLNSCSFIKIGLLKTM